MKRFITFAAAVLLGLTSAQEIPPPSPPAAENKTEPVPTPTPTPNLQEDFKYKSSNLTMPWDELTLAANAASCKIYEDLTLFDL